MDVFVVESQPPRVEIRNDGQQLHQQVCQDFEQATVYANGCVAGLKAAVTALGSLPLGFKTETPPRVAAARGLVGKFVRLRANPEAGPARVEEVLDDIDGGLRLSKAIDGSRGWNMDDVEVVELSTTAMAIAMIDDDGRAPM